MASELGSRVTTLVAAVIIAAGVYLGLRDRGGPDRGDPPPAPPAPPRPSPAAPPPRPPAHAAAGANAARALEGVKPDLIQKCWNPALARAPEPATARYLFDLTFDAAGKEIARGISEPRGESRADVGVCLRALPIGLAIPPPGENVRVEAVLVLP